MLESRRIQLDIQKERPGTGYVTQKVPEHRIPNPKPPVTVMVGRGMPGYRGPRTAYKGPGNGIRAYLPGVEVNRDQIGGSSRVRPAHCT